MFIIPILEIRKLWLGKFQWSLVCAPLARELGFAHVLFPIAESASQTTMKCFLVPEENGCFRFWIRLDFFSDAGSTQISSASVVKLAGEEFFAVYISGSQIGAPGPAASALPESRSEMQIIMPYPRSTESKTDARIDPTFCESANPPGDSHFLLNFETTGPHRPQHTRNLQLDIKAFHGTRTRAAALKVSSMRC